MLKTAILTGCAGFIGNNLLLRLLRDGWHVYGIDKLDTVSNTSDYIQYYNDYKGKFTFIAEDILDLKWLPNADVIFNLAADTHVDRSIDDSSNFIKNNILGVYNLLEAIINYKKKVRLVHISTDEV